MLSKLFVLIIAVTIAAEASGQQLPTANDVVAKMVARDNERQAALLGYTAARRYVLENSRHHKRAEMLIRVECLDNGAKQFHTVSESGWGIARNHLFPRLLEGEKEASQPDLRERSRITPKTHSKYLIQGKICVDSEDYAILRIEGRPAKNPSFWIKSVHFVHTYQKNGPFWLPASDRSVTDARIIGATELTIEYFNYEPRMALSASRADLASGSLR